MPFQLNGTDFGLAPYNQEWIDILVGTDMNGRPVYASTKNVRLDFDRTTVAKYQQFSALHGASLTSIQMLNIDAGSYTTYSNANIYLVVTQRPKFEAGNTTGFSVLISGVVPA